MSFGLKIYIGSRMAGNNNFVVSFGLYVASLKVRYSILTVCFFVFTGKGNWEEKGTLKGR